MFTLLDRCPKCGSAHLTRNGAVRGQQRKKCKDCGRQFTRITHRGKPYKLKSLAIFLCMHGVSLNRAGLICGVSAQTVHKWVRGFTSTEYPAMQSRLQVEKVDIGEWQNLLQQHSSQLVILVNPENCEITKVVNLKMA